MAGAARRGGLGSSGLAAVAVLVLAANAPPAAAQFNDQLVQAPKLAAPERGSIQGALSGVKFTASELARGAFRLPLAISAPQDRGPLQATVVPTYSPDAGLSEWGMGWSVDLSIKRHRLVGEIDFVNDELVSPWGRLRPGDDGKLYPSGLSTSVRVTTAGADWLATASDGTQYRFSAADGVTTPRGVYSWQLVEVTSLEGDRTTLAWTKNASGRPFLSRVAWGGRGHAAQYELVPSYEPLATAFVDHTTGTELDRRVTRVAVSVRDPGSGVLRERWHYQLGYRAAPFGPAFYLESAQRTFASGESQPAMVYHYELDDTRLPAAPLEHYDGLDAVLAALGDTAVQPNHAALHDLDADGQPDLEHASELTQIQHTDAGWIQTPLPAATGTDPRCRPEDSSDNQPRVLARLTGDLGPPHVLYTRLQSSDPETSEVLICDRLGHPISDALVPGDWQLGPNVRLVDVDRDRRPDLVRVSSAGVDVLRNDSDAQGMRFTPLPRFDWSLDFQPKVSWLNDFDGDGNIDVTVRTSDGLWVLFGLGGNQWTTTPVLFRLITQDGEALGRADTYQVSFVDANKDGLTDVVLSKGINVWLYTNRGDSFHEVPVDGFRNVQSEFGLPIIADLSGRGNTEVVFPTLGTSYVVELAVPSTGLLASADDGMGTIARFHYARSAPTPGIDQRITVLDQLTVESSGYDAVTFGYSYAAPVVHSAGKHLVGFGSVAKHSPQLTEQVTFRNDDDVSGVAALSEDTDDRTPGILRFTQRSYDDVTAHAVRWL
ncbi:MAG: FG-GAP-like repeat-containing protein, partial [Kofleriaceae bacterium]